MYLHLRCDVAETMWLTVESRTRISSYPGLDSWIYLHPRVGVHFGTQTQYNIS
ncbi:unnamed protein product [Schistosoma curassoni]|uniref:Uncharacterized protein n=1 Tax=Schistosoma curassoni TaxID=6186 RepID=A0A183JY98_9TREM|nr:unnamed protein product [Schistosoma curassoni]